MATETTLIDIKVTGGDTSAAQYAKVAGGAKKLDDTVKASNLGLNRHGETISKIGSVVSSLDPKLATLVSTLGRSTSAMGSLAMAIGGVPGVALGGVVGALALFAEYQDAAAQSAASLDKQLASQKKTLEELAREYEKAGMNAGEAEISALRNAAGASGLTPDRRAWLESRANALEQQQAAQRQASDYQAENAAAQAKINAALSTFDEPGKAGPSIYGKQSAAGAQMESVRAAGEERKRLYDEQMQALEYARDAERDADKERLREKLDAISAEYDAAKQASDDRIELRRNEAAESVRLEEEATRRAQLGRDVAVAGVKNLASNTIALAQKAAKGQKVSAKEFISAIGDQAVADGTFRILQGVGMLATLNPAGAAAIAAGSAEVAFGITLGAAGAGGGGRASGAASRVPPRPSEPYGGRSSEPRSTTSTINVQVSAMVADANAGRRISQAIQESRRVYGNAA